MTNVVEGRPETETGAPEEEEGRAADATRPLAIPWGAQGHRKRHANGGMRLHRSPAAATAPAPPGVAPPPVSAPVPAAAAAVANPLRAPHAATPPKAAPAGPALPVPPDDREKYSYIKRHSWLLTLGSLASFPLLLWSQMRLMVQYHWFWFYVPFVVMGVLFLALPLLTDGLSRGFNVKAHRRLVDSWKPEQYPSVDVFLPVCGEPADVLRNTWQYVALMSEYYQGTVTTYVLDDSASPELRAVARDFGFAYATRPKRGWFKKSGNLLWGFEVSNGNFVLLLDADFAPRHDLLNETLPHMDAYPDTGIVQTPQIFPGRGRPDLGRARRRRRAGTVLPFYSDGTRGERRRDLRRQLRHLPPGGAGR